MKSNKKVLEVITNWEKRIKRVMETGKGPNNLQYTSIKDLHDYLKLIKLIRQNKIRQASDLLYWFDTSTREEVPNTIYDFLNQPEAVND